MVLHIHTLRVQLSRGHTSTWGLFVLDGVQLHVEGFGLLLLGAVYGSLTRNVPLQHVQVQEVLNKLDQGWRGLVAESSNDIDLVGNDS